MEERCCFLYPTAPVLLPFDAVLPLRGTLISMVQVKSMRVVLIRKQSAQSAVVFIGTIYVAIERPRASLYTHQAKEDAVTDIYTSCISSLGQLRQGQARKSLKIIPTFGKDAFEKTGRGDINLFGLSF
jgi:hypothetical protein